MIYPTILSHPSSLHLNFGTKFNVNGEKLVELAGWCCHHAPDQKILDTLKQNKNKQIKNNDKTKKLNKIKPNNKTLIAARVKIITWKNRINIIKNKINNNLNRNSNPDQPASVP